VNYVSIPKNCVIHTTFILNTFAIHNNSGRQEQFNQKQLKMKITLNDQELELQVNKVDTPTGTGWSICMRDERKLVIKFRQGKWETADNVDDTFVQVIGREIDHFFNIDTSQDQGKSRQGLNPRPKRAGLL
jgi:hypothetical protein